MVHRHHDVTRRILCVPDTNKNRSSTCFKRPRPIFVCCEIVAVLSECRANFNSMPNSCVATQMKSPSFAPLPRAYPSASADDITGDPCVQLLVMIVQPPSCATPADVDLRSTLSVAQSLSTIISCRHPTRVPVSMSNRERPRDICRSALPLQASCGRIFHSSGTYWAFSGEEHQCAHNRTVLTVFSWTKQRFLIRNS